MYRMRRIAFCFAVVTVVAVSCCANGSVEPLRVNKIEVNGFWETQFERLTKEWLPHCIEQMEPGGRGQELLNLVNTAKALRGAEHGKFTGLPWSDAYVYNTVEAICLALAVDPAGDEQLAGAQRFLRDKVEEWIPIILAAQMENGYIHSYHVLNGRENYTDINAHEFYVMGYFLEMGVAHYRMTGGEDLRLYNAATKCADHLCDVFGPAPKRTWKNGHAGLEYALCRLGRLVDEVEGRGKGRKYFELAQHFLDHQHEIQPNPYNQSHRPAVQMTDAVGHAVRATYFYTAMADMALDGSGDYLAAVDRIWGNAIHRKHYITGGVGASHRGEAFSSDFDLRNDGYCESCAGCGMTFWADRMFRIHGDAHYHDVLERVLYNNVLGAMELTGENFFYQNPLASSASRYPWHGCPCCVGNIPRSLFAIKDLMYATGEDGTTLYVNHFVDSDVAIEKMAGTAMRIRQETRYPWRGDVEIILRPERQVEFALKLRIPDRTESKLYTAEPDLSGKFEVRVNGRAADAEIEDSYATIKRKWREGDIVKLSLPMEVQRVRCDERVIANRGRVAVIRGPLAYNFEEVDNEADVREAVPAPDAPLKAVWKPDMLEGIVAVETQGRINTGDGSRKVELTAVPNFVRLNRGGYSQVWMVEDPDKVAADVTPPEPARKVEPLERPDLEKRKIDRVVIADAESEKEHGFKGARTDAGPFRGRFWRHAGGGWFSYKVKVRPDKPNALLCTYWGSDVGNRRFDILVDGKKIAQQVLDRNEPDEFFDVEYAIPAELTQGKKTITVRFESVGNATAGGVFDLWMIEGKKP